MLCLAHVMSMHHLTSTALVANLMHQHAIHSSAGHLVVDASVRMIPDHALTDRKTEGCPRTFGPTQTRPQHAHVQQGGRVAAVLTWRLPCMQVYRGVQDDVRTVAVKISHQGAAAELSLSGQDRMSRNFWAETRRLADCRDANILTFYGAALHEVGRPADCSDSSKPSAAPAPCWGCEPACCCIAWCAFCDVHLLADFWIADCCLRDAAAL